MKLKFFYSILLIAIPFSLVKSQTIVHEVDQIDFIGGGIHLLDNGDSRFMILKSDANYSGLILKDYNDNSYGRIMGGSGFTNLSFGLLDASGKTFFSLKEDQFIRFAIDGNEKMRILANGNVGIGTTTPDYKLDVDGTIRAHEILVNLNEGADYVFAPEYNLRPLDEVETFIKENQHLPDVPSADEYRQNGASLSEMNNLLLQKIEELTLYMIDQKKELDAVKAQLSELKGE